MGECIAKVCRFLTEDSISVISAAFIGVALVAASAADTKSGTVIAALIALAIGFVVNVGISALGRALEPQPGQDASGDDGGDHGSA